MKQSFLPIFFTCITMISCNQQKKSTDTVAAADTAKPGEMKIMIPSSTCYANEAGKDTVLLKVEVFPNVVTGRITYKIFEKDSNKGNFDGRLHGDTLLADYTFTSEGKSSVRQVAFLIKDGTATEGYRDMEEKDGKMIFKDTQKLDFSKSQVLKKTDCGEY